MKLENHLAHLEAPEATAFRAVIERLRAAPEREPSAGLTGRILAAVDEERSRNRRRFRTPWPWWGAAAAAVAAGLIAAVTLINPSDPSCSPGPDPTLAWLVASQEPDGTWDPVRHGGAAEYRPALTALSALALTRASDGHEGTIDRACAALAALQTSDGAFGGAGRSHAYNQAITTYVLASLYARHPELKRVLEGAIGFIRTRQTAEGGWDYEAGSEGNAAITAWNVRALACAAEQGFTGADVPLRKGLRWLRGITRDDGSVAYHRNSSTRSDSLNALAAYALITAGKAYPGLPALGQHMARSLSVASEPQTGADCYRDYAKVLAFDAVGAKLQADAVRGHMLKNQENGESDPWQNVGGKLYTSALTALVAKR